MLPVSPCARPPLPPRPARRRPPDQSPGSSLTPSSHCGRLAKRLSPRPRGDTALHGIESTAASRTGDRAGHPPRTGDCPARASAIASARSFLLPVGSQRLCCESELSARSRTPESLAPSRRPSPAAVSRHPLSRRLPTAASLLAARKPAWGFAGDALEDATTCSGDAESWRALRSAPITPAGGSSRAMTSRAEDRGSSSSSLSAASESDLTASLARSRSAWPLSAWASRSAWGNPCSTASSGSSLSEAASTRLNFPIRSCIQQPASSASRAMLTPFPAREDASLQGASPHWACGAHRGGPRPRGVGGSAAVVRLEPRARARRRRPACRLRRHGGLGGCVGETRNVVARAPGSALERTVEQAVRCPLHRPHHCTAQGCFTVHT